MGPGHRLVASSVLALSTLLPLSLLHAADIYRWVDENGQTHLSDTVPDKYRDSATRVDTGPTELTPQQRAEAEARAAQQKKRAEEEAQRRARGEAADAGTTTPVSPAPTIQPAPRATKSSSDCAELLRRYRESQECFAPYRMANGAIRQEGFVLCGPDVPDPSGQCVQVNPD
jgi:hypothetical protein